MTTSQVPESASVGATTVLREACGHEGLDSLGVGGRAAYYRCTSCGQVFIEQDRRVWTIRPTVGA